MDSLAPSSPATILHLLQGWGRRTAFLLLLLFAALVPHLSSNGFDFPAVSSFSSLLPFCALFLLPLLDMRKPGRALQVDLLAMVSFVVALGCWRDTRGWPVLLIYPPLLYLFARMAWLARIGRRTRSGVAPALPRSFLSRRWLLCGIVVLVAVHISWGLEGRVSTDVAEGSVQGALKIAHGRALYGRMPSLHDLDPHTDTYGPANYEAYLPFAVLLRGHLAARVSTLFFDLLSALLLFVLGRQIRGLTAGIVLAYCWLAYPFGLYEEAFAFNDSLLAAALVAAVLLARSAAPRGAMAAVAAWTKLSPLALLPLLASRGGAERGRARELAEFGLAFALATALIFVPALAHSSLSTFISRSFGFQAQRALSGSIWAQLQQGSSYAAWIGTASRVVHGLLVAFAGMFAIVLLRAPRRTDRLGLAAASAAVLIAIELCLGYWSFSYILWFAPLVLLVVVLGMSSEEAVLSAPARRTAARALQPGPRRVRCARSRSG
jgi:hypothetical protein